MGHNVTQVTFRNCATFTKYITKIDRTTIYNGEDSDLVIPMQSFLEYSSYYSETTSSLRLYSKDEVTNLNNDIVNTNNFISFENKAKLLRNTEADGPNGIS